MSRSVFPWIRAGHVAQVEQILRLLVAAGKGNFRAPNNPVRSWGGFANCDTDATVRQNAPLVRKPYGRKDTISSTGVIGFWPFNGETFDPARAFEAAIRRFSTEIARCGLHAIRERNSWHDIC
jgi:hypothetical protein